MRQKKTFVTLHLLKAPALSQQEVNYEIFSPLLWAAEVKTVFFAPQSSICAENGHLLSLFWVKDIFIGILGSTQYSKNNYV